MKRGQLLAVSPDLSLPGDMVTQTFALLAVRRAGKSNAAAVMAELMYLLGLPFTVIDPKGDWWGLRSSADGKGYGLPIPIFGGLHGDMPLTPGSGALMARLIIEHNLTCILDVSGFSKAARARFLADFAEKLYSLHRIDPHPRHLFIEEADRVVPQSVMRADAVDVSRCVGAFSDIVRLGGSFGLGATLISQRSALISKDVLTQVETMIAMRTTSPQDRKAIKDWMEHHSISAEIVESLPGLLSGEAWVSSSFFLPEHGLPPISRIRFNQRTTYDSGATPKVGQPRKVATLADIDLRAVQAQMAEVTQEAEQNDPAALRREIARLKRELQKRTGEPDPRIRLLEDEVSNLQAHIRELEAAPPQIIEAPVISDEEVAAFRRVWDEAMAAHRQMVAALDRVSASRPAAPPPLARARPLFTEPPGPRERSHPGAAVIDAAGEGFKFTKAERAILSVLVQCYPAARTKAQVATLSGYTVKSSTTDNSLSRLRVAGLITRGSPMAATEEGVALLGDQVERLPSGQALVDHWMDKLGKAERAILAALLDEWPRTLSKEDIERLTGYSRTSSTMDNSLSRLRTLELISGYGEMAASTTLAEAALEGAAR